jgi:hypothetical protein
MSSIEDEWLEKADAGDGTFAIAHALYAVARSIDRLGNTDAATPMGAVEAFGEHICRKLDILASATTEIADSISNISVNCGG